MAEPRELMMERLTGLRMLEHQVRAKLVAVREEIARQQQRMMVRAVTYRDEGCTYADAGRLLGTTPAHVKRIVAQWRKQNGITSRNRRRR